MEEKQDEQGMTFDELSMKQSRDFRSALQELKDLRPQLYYAADYCEKSYLFDQQKRKVLENSKDYAVKALVNAVDHLGNVASQLNGLLSDEFVKIAATEVRINCLNQRVLASKEYIEGNALRQQYLVQTFPRYHKHYVIPATETKFGSRKESCIGQDRERVQLPSSHQGHTQIASNLISNPSLRNGVHTISSSSSFSSTSAHKTSVLPEVSVSVRSTSTSSSRSQSAAGTPRSLSSSNVFGAGLKDPIEGPKSSFSLENNHRRDVRQPPQARNFFTSFLHGRKSAKKRPNHVQ
ncbi:hypothetical protein SUGI_0585350 [Cryptomeria japonica]|uniref:protein ABIL1 n=1 Tax=Cryptomeria japonica TaxID=3369 RepID=UPI002414727C|nr:protein ABIL1 [Cryptomeria japonica]GLJ29680.1 hypothetical protein SUGI_0585350 [Cryptomeria japonica]